METNYRGFQISQPGIFSRKQDAKGNGTTSIKVVSDGVSGNVTLKTITYKRFDNKDLAKAVEKAKAFIDDILMEGKWVRVVRGEFEGAKGSIVCVTRKQVKKKPVLYFTINLSGEGLPPFATVREDETEFI